MNKWAVLAGFLLTSCAPISPQVAKYTKAGATQQEFMVDRYKCLKDAEEDAQNVRGVIAGVAISRSFPSCAVWLSCLAAQGYQLDQNGTLSASPGTTVQCR